jgi:hypothetical protein
MRVCEWFCISSRKLTTLLHWNEVRLSVRCKIHLRPVSATVIGI